MDSNYLKFGDLVLLNVEAVQGYVSSQGFTNQSVFVQRDNTQSQVFTRNFRDFIFQILPKLNYDARKDYESNLKMFNKNKSSSNNAAQGGQKDNLLNTARGGQGVNRYTGTTPLRTRSPMGGKGTDQLQQMVRQQQEEQLYQKKMQHLLKKLNEEEEMNRKVVERKRGEQVAYGNEIQLKHVDSHSFLSAKKYCADIDKSCNKIQLQEHGSTSIFFKVMPRYKYRQEGEKVLYKDQVVLFNIKLNLYLHITERVLPIEKPLPLPKLANNPSEEITSKEPDRRTPPCDYVPMFEVNASTTLSRFQVVPFSQFYENDRMYIRGGSVIRLQHSELGGYLASDDEDFTNDGLAEVFLWSYKKKFDELESQNTASLFEIEIAHAENRGQICQQSQGEYSNDEMLFRLRHFNTGRLVIDQEIQFDGEKILTLGLSNHLDLKADKSSEDGIDLNDLYVDPIEKSDLEDRTLFRLISTKVDLDSRIKAQTCVKIQHVKTKNFLCVMKKGHFINASAAKQRAKIEDETIDLIGNDGQPKKKQNHALFQQIDDDEIYSGNRNVIELKSDASYENAFFLQLEDHDQLKNILFVHTSIGILKKLVPLLCYKDADITKDKVLKIKKILQQMTLFVQVEEEGTFVEQEEVNQTFNNQNDFAYKKIMIKKRQKILKELSMIEFIVQILYYPFSTKTYSLDGIKPYDNIATICAEAYGLLTSIVVEYELNGLYASQWVNLFFMQAMKTSMDNCIKAQDFINNLVEGNRKLLEIQITPKIIYQFIQICRNQNKHKRLIKLLTSLCSCNDQAVQNNQLDIITFLLEEEETKDQLMMPIQIQNDDLEVKYFDKNYVMLKILDKYSQERDKGQFFQYFLSIVGLSAELCLGRNFKAYQQLVSIFPFQAVLKAVTNKSIQPQIRSKFARLLHYMHMDREQLEALQIPILTLVWKDLPIYKDIQKNSSHGYLLQQSKLPIPGQLEPVKKFVLQHLQDAKGVQNILEKHENQLMIEILKIMKFMLKHGFYKDQEELNEIANPLIPLLSGADDKYRDQNNISIKGLPDNYLSTTRYNYTKQNEIILNSKKLQCQILIYISQLEIDGKTQCFLAKYKDDYNDLFGLDQTGGLKSQLFEKVQRGIQLPSALQRLKTKNMNDEMGEDKSAPGQAIRAASLEFLQQLSQLRGFEEQSGDHYVIILFDLLLYKYPVLNKAAFELLIRYFTRTRTLMESIFNVQMLEFPRSIEVLNKVKFFQSELKIHVTEADQWMNKKDKLAQDTKTRVTQIFQVMTRQCSNNDHIDDENIEHHQSINLSEDGVNYSRLTEEEEEFIIFKENTKQTNKENQRIMRNFSIHELAVFCIKYRIEQNATNNDDYNQMIKQCYRFLIEFVRDNIENQLKLRDFLDIFLKDIDKYALAILLVYEIFKENKRFLNLNVNKIVKQVVISQEEQELNSSKKGSLLKLMTVFCKYQDKLVRQNQIDIIQQITKDVARSRILYLFSNEGFNELSEFLNAVKEVEINQSLIEDSMMLPQINISIEIFNVMTCLHLLSVCCEGKSDQAEIKCQNEILTLKNAVRILLQVEQFWPFKLQLVNYMTQCFLDSNQKDLLSETDEVNLKPLWEASTILVSDIENIIKQAPNEDDIQVKFPSGEIKSLKQTAFTYFFEGIINFFHVLLKRKNLEIGLNEKIIIKMGRLTAKIYYMCEDDDFKQKAYALLSYIYHKEKYARYLDNIKHPVIINDEKGAQIFKSKLSGDREKKLRNLKTSKMNVNLMQIPFDRQLQENIEEEFENMVLWITNIDQKIEDIVQHNPQLDIKAFANLKFNQILASLLKLLDSQCLEKDLHISGLKIIRKIIEIENKGLNTPAADWDTEDWVNYKSMIMIKQNALVDIGCIQFLCRHISEVEDEEILEECLLSCISLLLGGNSKTQEAFHKFLSEEDEQNQLLLKIKKMLIQQFEIVKQYLSEKNAKLQMLSKNYERKKEKEEQKQKRARTSSFNKKEQISNDQSNLAPPQLIKEASSQQEPEASEENLLTLDDTVNYVNGTEEDQKSTHKEGDESHLISQNKQLSLNKCMRMLRFLQLLTENHYTLMQNFLREQKMVTGVSNPKSFDFVSYVSFMLGAYEKSFVNCYSCSLGYQMIETLTEFIQGPCKENQRALVSAKVIDNCRDLISHGAQSEKESRQQGFFGDKILLLDGLQMKAVRLLLSIIEGPKDLEIIRHITLSLDDFVIVFERMQHVYDEFFEKDLQIDINSSLDDANDVLKKDSFDNGVLEAFDLFILINQLADSYPPAKQKVDLFAETKCYKFLDHHTQNIEVLIENQLQKVYFPVKPVCNYLSQQSKDNLMQNVDRQSPQHKILGLLKAVPDLIDEMEHVESLSRSKFQILTPDRVANLKDLSIILSFLISCIMIGFYKYEEVDSETDIGYIEYLPTINQWASLVITILGYTQIVTVVIVLVGWIINKGNLVIKSKWRDYNDSNKVKYSGYLKNKQENSQGFNEKKASDLSLYEARMLLQTHGPEADEFQSAEGGKDFYYFILKVEYLWTSLIFIVLSGPFKQSLIQIGLAALGVFQSPLFFVFGLLNVITRFSTLKNVIQSVSLNSNQLLLTAVLGIIIIYIYSIIGFQFFSSTYFNPDIVVKSIGEKGDSVCQELLHCFITTFNYGLRYGGGIGEFLSPLSYENDPHDIYYFRVIFDLTFFLIVIVILLNIIFGIIIDTFAELRDNKQNIDDDMKNTCFICSLTRQTFDRDSEGGFDYHLIEEHSIWAYLYFIIHLKTKDETDFNGTESYIAEKFEQEDISWFPLHKALSLTKEAHNHSVLPQDEEENIEAPKGSIQALTTKINEVDEMLNNLESTL